MMKPTSNEKTITLTCVKTEKSRVYKTATICTTVTKGDETIKATRLTYFSNTNKLIYKDVTVIPGGKNVKPELANEIIKQVSYKISEALGNGRRLMGCMASVGPTTNSKSKKYWILIDDTEEINETKLFHTLGPMLA